MSDNAHTAEDLRQMQALPLEAKIIMTKQRIKAWYDAWVRFEIFDEKTEKTRFVTFDTREQKEPPMNETEYVVSAVSGWVYLSFSGGKDSTVLKHIIDSMYDDVPSLFVNTGLEYPEIQRFAMSQKNVVTVRPAMRFDEVIKKYGYPVGSKETASKIEFGRKALDSGDTYYYKWYVEGKRINSKTGEEYTFMPLADRFKPLFDAREIMVSQRCCSVMKKKPSEIYARKTGRKVIVGTMADESKMRRLHWLKEGCNAFDNKKPTSKPLSFWTEQDILHYIKKYNVSYCSVYGDIVIDFNDGEPEEQMNLVDLLGAYEPSDRLKTTGYDRTGCIFCMFGITQDGCPNRFQRLKKTHPRQYEYCICGGEYVDGKWQPSKAGLGLGKVLDFIGVKYD